MPFGMNTQQSTIVSLGAKTNLQRKQKLPSDNEQLVTLFSKGLHIPAARSIHTLTSDGNSLIITDTDHKILCIVESDCIRLNNQFVNTEIEKTVEEFATKQKRKIIHMEVDDKYRDRLLMNAVRAERVPWRVQGEPSLPSGDIAGRLTQVYFR